MKKTLLVVACLLILAVPAVFAQAYTANLAPLRLHMVDSFEWSNGYQGTIATRNLLSGNQLKVGETYTLQMKFTASRDLEDELTVVFVDTTDKAKPNIWWSSASDYFVVGHETIKGGKEYTSTVTFVITEPTSSAAPSANAMVFATKGEGKPGPDPKTPGVKGSGVKKPFTINFTEFTLTRK